MTAWPQHVVIAGGGTAGWLAALILQDVIRRDKRETRLTVVESSKIGTIGVGEGTTAVFRQMLQHLRLDEEAFLRDTGATIKYGIRHRDWRRLCHHYDGPIDDPGQIAGPGLDLYAVASGRSVGEAHLFQHLIERARAPVAQVAGRTVPAGPFQHAFHVDQALVGKWLRTQAKGVDLIDDQITGVTTAEDGIASIALEGGASVTGDLFLDCTGFRRVLISALGSEWVDYAASLPVNRAMPFWIDLTPDREIPPYTLAWAQKAGWMWQIPTQERLGCGYVYSDAHLSPDQAKAEIETVLGHPIEPRNDIPIRAGRLKDAWRGNTVALGLSSSFLEPLEATSIHGTIVQLLMLAAMLGKPGARATYNRAVARQVDDFRDFIRLHYMGERRDTAFWQDVADSHPPHLVDRVALWRTRLPERADFEPLPMRLPHVEEQLHIPVLDGLGLLDRASAKNALSRTPERRAALRKTHGKLTAEYRRAASRCRPHRDYLRALSKEQVQ